MAKSIPPGAIDCHLHHSPDVLDRRQWAFEYAEAAAAAGMGGIVLKSHHANTAGVARQVDRLVPGIKVMGGVALNAAVGGLNPSAVRMAGQFGARMLWMPTTSAANHVRYLDASVTMSALRSDSGDEPLTILGDDGLVLPVVGEILGEAKAANMGLATGHLSPDETIKFVEHAHQGGYPMNRIVVTHGDMPFTYVEDDVQTYFAELGVLIERLYMLVLAFHREASPDALEPGTPYTGESFYMASDVGFEGMCRRIRDMGVSHSMFSSDLGQAGNPLPIDAMGRACGLLRDAGFSEEELRIMAVDSPTMFLGL
jgi:hypothetical protein